MKSSLPAAIMVAALPTCSAIPRLLPLSPSSQHSHCLQVPSSIITKTEDCLRGIGHLSGGTCQVFVDHIDSPVRRPTMLPCSTSSGWQQCLYARVAHIQCECAFRRLDFEQKPIAFPTMSRGRRTALSQYFESVFQVMFKSKFTVAMGAT